MRAARPGANVRHGRAPPAPIGGRMTRRDTTHGCTTVRTDLRDGGRVMASIVRDAIIEAPAARCWDAIRDFAALPDRLARGVGTGLTLTGEGGGGITLFSRGVA